jgi:hypothetical protein
MDALANLGANLGMDASANPLMDFSRIANYHSLRISSAIVVTMVSVGEVTDHQLTVYYVAPPRLCNLSNSLYSGTTSHTPRWFLPTFCLISLNYAIHSVAPTLACEIISKNWPVAKPKSLHDEQEHFACISYTTAALSLT